MNVKKMRFGKILIQLMIVFTVGILIFFFFFFLILARLVKIIGFNKFPHFKGKKIIISNHSSLIEPILCVFLCCISYLRHPLQGTPIGVVDKINFDKKDFYGAMWLWWIRLFCISVSRSGESNNGSIKEILRALKLGKKILLFPEGGRTSTGDGHYAFNKFGRFRIREVLTEGAVVIAQLSGAAIVPVCFYWSDALDKNFNIFFPWKSLLSKKLTIIVGDELYIGKKEDRAKATLRLRDCIIKLSEKVKI